MNQLQKALEIGKVNNWTVLEESDRYGFVKCRCVCGYTGDVKLQGLFNGKSKSCGCTFRIKRRESRRDGFINDVDCTTKEDKIIRNHWKGMINRVTDNSRYFSYNNCSICEDWRRLSNFMTWANTFKNIEGMHLDKDLLVGNKQVYSPSTCCFVEPKVNLAISIKRKDGELRNLPMGVIKRKSNSKIRYIAQCNVGVVGKPLWIGTFDNPLEAHIAWMEAKREYLIQLLEESSCDKTKKGLSRIVNKLSGCIINRELLYDFD